MNTRITELFDIELPIILGGMVWASTPPLVAAVSNAGGLGLLAGGSVWPEDLAAQIGSIREMTDRPFGINVPCLNPMAPDLIEIALREGVRIFFTSAGSPARFTPALKEAGCKVVHVVPGARFAKKAEAAGVDAVVAEGAEGGGHIAHDEVATMVLVPKVLRSVDIPVIAAGGIGTGEQVAAAFALGAEGVQIGTRFIATTECTVHEKYKQAIIEATETGTQVTGRGIEPLRALKSPLGDQILRMQSEGKSVDEIKEFIGPQRSYRAGIEGDMEQGTAQAGQVVGLIDDIQPATKVIDGLMSDARKAVERMTQLFR